MDRRRSLPFALATLAAVLAAGIMTAGPANAKGIAIKKATFAREVTDDFTAKGVTTKFRGNETVFLLLQVKGRPKSGKVEAQWSFRGNSIGKADVDLSSVNKGLLFSAGQDTYVKFNFTPGKEPLPIGTSYEVAVMTDGKPAGTYPFEVIPTATAIPSKVTKNILSKSDTPTPATTFAPTDTVYLLFTGDFGVGTWVEAQWTISGAVEPKATRSLTLTENKTGVDGNFYLAPPQGWPKGKHSVTLYMNDRKVVTLPFTVA
jgi:hypothetical protein